MIAVVVTDRRKVSVQDKATTAPIDSESDEHFSCHYNLTCAIRILYKALLQSFAV